MHGEGYPTQAREAGLYSKRLGNSDTKEKGFFKIIVSNDHGMRIMGIRVVGEDASYAIQGVAYLINTNQCIRELADMMHPHPSIIEGFQ